MGFSNSPNKATAQTLSDIQDKIQSGQGVEWSDYSDIRHLQNDTIPKTLQYLDGEIDRIEKIPVTTTYTQEMKNVDKQEWEKYKQSIETLQKSWKDGSINIENHREEAYGKTKELVRGKLKELLGDIIVTEIPRTSEVPVEDVGGNKAMSTSSDASTTENVPANIPTIPTASPQKTKSPQKSPARKSKNDNGDKIEKENLPIRKITTKAFPRFIDQNKIQQDSEKVYFPIQNAINASDNTRVDYLRYPVSNLNQPSGEKTITDILIGNVFYKSISIKHTKESNGKIIFGYSETKEDFSKLNNGIKDIRKRVSQASDLRYLTAKQGDNQYFRNVATQEVEYAIINQGSGIEVIYDIPTAQNTRNIYVLRKGNITGMMKIGNNNKIIDAKGEKIENIQYKVLLPTRVTN